MEKESSTKDVCNAISKNKGLFFFFNGEASLSLMSPPANLIVSLL